MSKDLTGLQRDALLLAELSKRVKAAIAANKASLLARMVQGQTNRPTVEIDGHKTQAGIVVYTDPEAQPAQWVESDPDAHVAWLDKWHPTEVEVITRPRSAFTSTYVVVGEQVMTPAGTVVEGVTVVHPASRPGHIAVTPAKDARIAEALWDLVRSAPAELIGGTDDE